MKRHALVWVGLVVGTTGTVLSGVGWWIANSRARELGGETLRVLDAPRTVEVCRLDPANRLDPGNQESSGSGRIAGYKILGSPGQPPAAHQRELRAALVDATGAWIEERKACLFQPGAAYRFTAPDATVSVLICFDCDELLVIRTDGNGRWKQRVWQGIDSRRPRFVALVKQAFPDDALIQSLPAAR